MSALRGNNGPRYKHAADQSAPYDTITVDKLTPIIGAEIGGVDLSQPLGNQTFQEIHRALAENLVIFFRDQHITEEQHLDFGRKFGKLPALLEMTCSARTMLSSITCAVFRPLTRSVYQSAESGSFTQYSESPMRSGAPLSHPATADFTSP